MRITAAHRNYLDLADEYLRTNEAARVRKRMRAALALMALEPQNSQAGKTKHVPRDERGRWKGPDA